jgi:ferrous iron transport protein B
MTTATFWASRPVFIKYPQDVETEIEHLSRAISAAPAVAAKYNPRWLAIQLLEGDETLIERASQLAGGPAVIQTAQASLHRLEKTYGEDVDTVLADHRYGFVNGLVRQAVTRTVQERLTLSDKIDRVVTHRLLGIPIFLAMMWVVFKFTADISAPYLDWVDGVISGPLTNWTVSLLGLVGLGGTWVESLAVDGVIAGVGGVLVFVPVLMSLYLVLAVLEDSGYMARAAFVMDRLMRALGLHGKSFLPMVVGFGGTVPAFYATRTLENEKDRILTGLLVPFMSCGARLPVYVLFAAIFFPQNAGSMIFSMYLLGIAVAIGVGLILKNTLFKTKEQAPFVMELPPYRMPTLRGIWFHVWERTSGFVRKAWTIILAVSIVLWFLLAIPVQGEGSFAETEVDDSLFATASGLIAPAFAPLGFGTWEAGGSLLTGFVAKEVVISTMAQIYGVEEAEEAAEPTTFLEDVGQIVTSFIGATIDTVKSIPLIVGINLFEAEEEPEPTALMGAIEASFVASSGGHGALAGLAFMIFVLLYTPCMVAVAAERQEFGAKWMWFSIIGQLAIAWLMAFLVFQGGVLLGLG